MLTELVGGSDSSPLGKKKEVRRRGKEEEASPSIIVLHFSSSSSSPFSLFHWGLGGGKERGREVLSRRIIRQGRHNVWGRGGGEESEWGLPQDDG